MRQKPGIQLCLWLLLVLAFSGASSHAAITVVSYWRMGENDPGAASGVAATNLVDIAGTHNLTVHGTAPYTNDMAATAANHTGSSLSVSFANGAHATSAIVSTASDNFGVECWVKPRQMNSNQVILYNGVTGGGGSGGWGLFLATNNTYEALYGGVTAFGTNVATSNTWTYLALVCAGGVSTLYVNGVPAATNVVMPAGPSGNFALAAPPQAPTNQFFTGSIDEVRVFTFAPGQFSTNVLLWNQTGPTTLPALALSSTNAELNGTLNPNGVDNICWFQYGLTTNYDSVTPTTFVSGTNPAAVSISDVVGGLSPGATYHFRLVGSNAFSVVFGADLAFTLPVPVAPGISGQSASGITTNSATLNASVTVNAADTTAWFQYGLTTNYDNFIALRTLSGTNQAAIPISSIISPLSAGAVYHFQTVAMNAAGTSYGGDQTFSTPAFVQSSTPFPGLIASSVVVGDVNNDGLMDILISGQDSSHNPHTQLWLNTGGGFTNVNVGVTAIHNGSVALGDFDNDGLLDILLCGASLTNFHAEVWRNTGSGFTNINAGLPGVIDGSAAWGDYDNDGRLDILLCGRTPLGPLTQVWRNTGSGFTNINAGLPAVSEGMAVWGDFDNDGRLDILLCGFNGTNYITQVWRNTGNGFTNINAGLPGVTDGSVAWGDYDNDGRLDILLCGSTGPLSGAITQVWRNTGNGFTNINAGLPGLGNGTAAWGDYDNDGLLDILLCGQSTGPITQIWRNTGNGFVKIQDLPGVDGPATAAWGDFNNDGRLDVLFSGQLANSSLTTQLWPNQTSSTNSPPTAPTGLSAALGSSLTLSWNASSDLQTPAPGLGYNLRVGTTPGGSDLIAPMANTNGTRLLPQRGNVQGTQKILQLPVGGGTTIYWSVQSIDSSFAGSPFAPESSFLLRPFFSSSGLASDGTFQAQFDVESGTNYTIQASTDMVHWADLLNFTFGSSGPVLFTDPGTTNYPRRFYRVGQH